MSRFIGTKSTNKRAHVKHHNLSSLYFLLTPILLSSFIYLDATKQALAACDATGRIANGSTVTCENSSGVETHTIGTGRGNDNVTVKVEGPNGISVGNSNAISLGNNANITIDGATVENNATNSPGNYGTGANVIEVNSNSTINIDPGSVVRANGTENNGEAINVHGYGNTINISSFATVESKNGAAIWFQDLETSATEKNTINNSGLITRGNGTGNVIGTSAKTGAGIVFNNRTGGRVEGDLLFAGGDDDLIFDAGSVVTGNINGGGGTNTLTLNGGANSSDELKGALKNFQSLTKKGDGTWTVSGPLQGFDTVLVEDGVLALTGNNAGFSGSVTVDANGELQARAQSLPTKASGQNANNVTNNGLLHFVNDTLADGSLDNGTYVGQITGTGSVLKTGAGTVSLSPEAAGNTYTGGTVIQQGGIGITSDSALGDAAGKLTLGGNTLGQNGTLQLDANLSTARTIEIDNGGGTIYTQGYNGTVSSNITNVSGANGGLTKTGTGTLALDGNNTYKGETNINGGTLIINGNNSANGAVNGSAIGTTNVNAGTLQVNGYLHSQDTINNGNGTIVRQNARLEGTGIVAGGVSSAGVVAPGIGGQASGVLTIKDGFNSYSGSIVEINTVLGDDRSATSKLVIEGGIEQAGAYAPSGVKVNNRGGLGANTNQGIKIIEVHGNSPKNQFRLIGDYTTPEGKQAVVGGAYVYSLYQGTPTANDGNWYLRTLRSGSGTPVLNPSTPLYEVYPQVLATFNRMSTLQQRVGNRSWYGLSSNTVEEADANQLIDNSKPFIEEAGIWTRVEGSKGSIKSDVSATDSRYDLDYWRFQAGIDIPLYKADNGSTLVGGLTGHYGKADSDVKSHVGKGSIDVDGYGFGGTLTWYGQKGFYIDGQAQATWLTGNIKSKTLNAKHQTTGNDGFAYAFSVESGKQVNLDKVWSLTPQAQLTFSDAKFNSFTDTQGAHVSLKKSKSLQGRVGLAVNRDTSFKSSQGDMRRVRVYTIANIYNEFLDGTKVEVTGMDFSNRQDRLWGGVAVGGSYNLKDDKYSIYGEVGARTSLKNVGDSNIGYGEVGVRMKF